MSEKHKGSTLAALALAGVVALSPGPATSQDSPQVINTNNTTAVADTAQQQGVRYLDLTARNDGWANANGLAVSGSLQKRIVIVSYADTATTRAIYDVAVNYSRSPHNLPIFGVVRAPDHPTQRTPYGFQVFFDGGPIGHPDVPPNTFSRLDLVAEALNGIQRNSFGKLTNSTVDADGVRLARNNYTGTGTTGTGSGSGTGSAGSAGGSTGDTGGKSGGGGDTTTATEVAVVFDPDF